MRTTRQNTFVLSLLLGILVIYRALSIEGLTDILWVILMGYLIVKGIRTLFSREQSEWDIGQTYQKRVFYQDIFGRFAYIAPELPLIAIILAGMITYISPVTPMLRVTTAILLAFSVIYAAGINLYFARYKKAVENENWETEKLNTEKERAWKRSDFCHNMMYFTAASFLIFYFIFGDPVIYINNHRLKAAISEVDEERITLEEIVPFEWTAVYSFGPYFPLQDIERITGSKSPALDDSVTEEMNNLVFMNHGRVVSSVCERPSSTGYSLNLAFGEGIDEQLDDCDRYSKMDYGDGIEFTVILENGVLNLKAVEQK